MVLCGSPVCFADDVIFSFQRCRVGEQRECFLFSVLPRHTPPLQLMVIMTPSNAEGSRVVAGPTDCRLLGRQREPGCRGGWRVNLLVWVVCWVLVAPSQTAIPPLCILRFLGVGAIWPHLEAYFIIIIIILFHDIFG
ncbi:hypothetical protein TraAM80_10241, partial [Trypanosoma rangeli]